MSLTLRQRLSARLGLLRLALLGQMLDAAEALDGPVLADFNPAPEDPETADTLPAPPGEDEPACTEEMPAGTDEPEGVYDPQDYPPSTVGQVAAWLYHQEKWRLTRGILLALRNTQIRQQVLRRLDELKGQTNVRMFIVPPLGGGSAA